MRIDDLISSCKFLTRRQLLQFCRANRLTLSIVEEHFAEWPAIYSELTIVHKGKNKDAPMEDQDQDFQKKPNKNGRLPIDSFMELKSLNCDCEQQLSININELWTYKVAVKCECKQKQNFWSDENEGEHFELKTHHKNCKEDWIQLENLNLIPQFRRHSYFLSKLIREKYSCHYGSTDKCCKIFAHKLHDQTSRNLIVKDYIIQHRRQNLIPEQYDELEFSEDEIEGEIEGVIEGEIENEIEDEMEDEIEDEIEGEIEGEIESEIRGENNIIDEVCSSTALLLRTTNVNKMIAHLKMKFIKIYKLHLRPIHWHYYYGDENDKEEGQQNLNVSNEEMCLKILQWIMENGKITNATTCNVDVNLIDELLGNLVGNDEMKQHILSIGKCGHLHLMSDEFIDSTYWENLLVLQLLQEMLIKNSLMISIGPALLLQYSTMLNLLQIYNSQGNHRRLIIFLQEQNVISVQSLIYSFLNSNERSTYFIMIGAHFERKKYKQKYYNAKTNEYLRIQPGYRYSVSDPNDIVEVYLARYSKLSTIAEEEFESFFGRVEQNVAKRITLCEKEIERKNYEKDNYGTWAIVPGKINMLDPGEDEEVICSFSSFLAKLFPGFSLNIGNQARNASNESDAEELYNAGYAPFRRALLPPQF